MNKNIFLIIAAAFTSTALAGPYDPIITNAWTGETLPSQPDSTLQMKITTVKSVRLVEVSTPAASKVEIHSLSSSKKGVKVSVLPTYVLPDHQNISFGTRGLYLMMKDIKQPLKIGERIPVSMTFVFPDKKTVTKEFSAEVRKVELSYKGLGNKNIYEDHH